mmetsp:Transcript_28635/g.41805  ORF Transcript_28635/g.41805 Transcript_28635/m.41805 type:complete len:203 (+) Transcript_28635:278-886(+)
MPLSDEYDDSTAAAATTPSSNNSQNRPTWKNKIIETWTHKVGSWPPTGASVGFYVMIETAWHVSLFAACYRYRPLTKLLNTAGKSVPSKFGGSGENTMSKRLKDFLEKKSQTLKSNGFAIGQRTAFAASEWFIFNKIIGIPLWPSKIFLAGWFGHKYEVKRRETMDTHRRAQRQQEDKPQQQHQQQRKDKEHVNQDEMAFQV